MVGNVQGDGRVTSMEASGPGSAPGRRWTRAAALGAAAALAVVISACSSGSADNADATTTTTQAPVPIGAVTHRPVLAILPPNATLGPDVLVELDTSGAPVMAYRVGPAVESAVVSAEPMSTGDGRWQIQLVLAPGPDGIGSLNDSARSCHDLAVTCPTGQLAIVADGQVVSAPRIEPDQQAFQPFAPDQITIGSAFYEAEARALATKIRGG